MPVGERYMEFLHAKLTQSVANASMLGTITMPVSGNENLACLIHQIKMAVEPEIVAAVQMVMKALVRDRATGNHNNIADEGVLACFCGFIQPTLYIPMCDFAWYFDPPILYAKSVLHLFFTTSNFVGATNGNFQIGYTIDKVSKDAFIAALVA